MKIQKIGLNFKISSARAIDISSSKVTSPRGDELHISRNARELQAKSVVNPTYPNPGTAVNFPKINQLNSLYSQKRIESGQINDLKSFRKIAQRDSLKVNPDKTPLPVSDIREEKIKEAKIKLAQGYYYRVEVYSKVAERIIDVLI